MKFSSTRFADFVGNLMVFVLSTTKRIIMMGIAVNNLIIKSAENSHHYLAFLTTKMVGNYLKK